MQQIWALPLPNLYRAWHCAKDFNTRILILKQLCERGIITIFISIIIITLLLVLLSFRFKDDCLQPQKCVMP